MPFVDLRDFDEFRWARGCRDSELDTVGSHGNLGCEAALVEHVGVHLQARVDKLREVDTNLSHKLHASRGHKGDFALWKHFQLLSAVNWNMLRKTKTPCLETHHIAGKLESTLDARGEGSRQGNPQGQTGNGGKEELIVHEDVVGEHGVVGPAHHRHKQLQAQDERLLIETVGSSGLVPSETANSLLTSVGNIFAMLSNIMVAE